MLCEGKTIVVGVCVPCVCVWPVAGYSIEDSIKGVAGLGQNPVFGLSRLFFFLPEE